MDYFAELKKLPAAIQDILISSFGAAINQKIIAKYKLTTEQGEKIINWTNDFYLHLLDAKNLKDKITAGLSLTEPNAKNLVLDIAGWKLLIADDYFQGAIKKYITDNGGDLSGYQTIVAQEQEAIKKERTFDQDEADKPERVSKFIAKIRQGDDLSPVSQKQEKLDTVTMFKEDLVSVLEADHDSAEAIEDFNNSLSIFLLDDTMFRAELEAALYNNQEKITAARLTLENRELEPTIANWLKDFIKINGSEFFNEVVLAQYLGSSTNASRLDQEEKRIVGKLLKLYRNLVFFPESMQDKPLDKWEIIPVDYNEGAENKGAMVSRVKAGSKRTPVDDVLSNDRAAKMPEGARVKTPEAEKLSFGESWPKLEEILQKYTPGTLEYKAIKEEISRLKKKK